MKTYWETLAAIWDKKTAKTRRDERLVYVGDIVIVTKGRKVPIGTVGRVISMTENRYDPITYDNARGALTMHAIGWDIDAIQRTNAKIKLVLDNGKVVYTYLRNIKKSCLQNIKK